MKSLFLVLAFVAVVSAYPKADKPKPYAPPPPPPPPPSPAPKYEPAPAPYKPPPPQYKPAPSPYKPPSYEKEEVPQPYAFEYGVSDSYTGTNYKAVESQDDKGTVLGSYIVNLPDGRVQTVTYHADKYGGYVADVKYEGEAQYPPEPAEGYGNTYKSKYGKPAPKYAPAPPKYEA